MAPGMDWMITKYEFSFLSLNFHCNHQLADKALRQRLGKVSQIRCGEDMEEG